ncbi:unnamed protein product [Alopecurus aequalis]
MTALSNMFSGAAAGMFPRPAEYGFARRFRHKLLLSYLSQQRLHPTFNSMLQQTDAHMCGDHLQRLVVRGQWAEALNYLGRFNSRRTVASNALYFFLHTVWALDNVAAGAKNGSVKSSAHIHGMALSTVICRCAKLCSVVKPMLDSPQQCVALDWKRTRIRAAMSAYRLAGEDPDLNRLMQLPGDGRMLPQHVLSIINPRRRRHAKRLPAFRAPAPAIARLYLNKRRSLHSSSPHTPALFLDESLDRVAGLVDECIKYGMPRKQLQSVVRVPAFLMPLETAPAAPILQTNSRATSVPNAGAPVSSQLMSQTFTNQDKHSGISSAQSSAC